MNAIVVVNYNWSIGKKGQLLNHLPGDLAYFKEKTLGKTLVMGRETLDSLPHGKPLPGREHVILTKNTDLKIPGCMICHSREQVLKQVVGKEVFVAGGEQTYRLFFEDCRIFYVTMVLDVYHGDRFFPNLDQRDDMKLVWWSEIKEEQDKHYVFRKYERIECV